MGTIPIVERGWGFDRLFSVLPVLAVDHFENVTASLLEAIYPLYVLHARDFLWEALTHDFWMNMIKTGDERSALATLPFPRLPAMVRPGRCPDGAEFVKI